MISSICCFTKSAVNYMGTYLWTPPNQPDYPWFSKCTLKLGLEKPVLINSADMSHLTPFSHWSIYVTRPSQIVRWKNIIDFTAMLCVTILFFISFDWFLPNKTIGFYHFIKMIESYSLTWKKPFFWHFLHLFNFFTWFYTAN